MDQITMMAYSEVDQILNLIDKELKEKVPIKLRILISKNKLNNYRAINPEIPLKQQNISRKALAILAVLDYNYWTTDEEKRKKLIEKYNENERIEQEKAREKYNTDKLFASKNISLNKNLEQEEKQLIIYNKKDNFFTKMLNKIKEIFNLT